MSLGQRLSLIYIRTKFKVLSAISKEKAAATAFELFCTPPTRDRKELPELFKSAENLQFQFENENVTGYRWNSQGSKTVLILHGFESTAINFAAYVPPLIAKGYTVLAFDAPAHGHSTGKTITAIVYRDMIKHIHKTYGPVRSFVGNSLGGFVLTLALAEIAHDESYRAVVIAPSTETSTAINHFFHVTRLDKDVRRNFEQLITEISGHPVSWFSMSRTVEQIDARILWIHDEEDRVTPFRDALNIKLENHPHVEFVITKGLGHSGIYRNPQVIKTVVDFL